MGWFKKKEVVEDKPKEEEKPLEVFSTHWKPSKSKAKRALDLKQKLAITFQRGIEDVKRFSVKGDGNFAMDSVAMDTVTEKLSTSYLRNSAANGLTEEQFAWFAGQGFIGYQACAMLAQNWLIDKACTIPAQDSVRNGYEITVTDGTEIKPDVLDEMQKLDKRYKLNKNLVEFVRNGKIFGVRIALFVVESNDPNYYYKPFNPDGVTKGSYKGISQIDPYWVTPLLDNDAVSNPASIDFYEPTWWNINGKPVHKSHLVVMNNGEVPDILKPSYLYGGYPIPQLIAERVYASERTANEAPMLAMSKRLTVLSTDVTQAVANQDAFEDKMRVWTDFMNNYGVKIVGESDNIQQFDTSLTDLDQVIMTQFQLVASASRVPATKLLGTSPKGFNATGEYEESSYHEELESLQTHHLLPLIDRHHMLLIRSEIAPKFNIKPFSTSVEWLPTNASTDIEKADLNLKKAQTDEIYVNAGAIDGADIRDRIISDRDSGYNGLESIEDPLDVQEDINYEQY